MYTHAILLVITFLLLYQVWKEIQLLAAKLVLILEKLQSIKLVTSFSHLQKDFCYVIDTFKVQRQSQSNFLLLKKTKKKLKEMFKNIYIVAFQLFLIILRHFPKGVTLSQTYFVTFKHQLLSCHGAGRQKVKRI